MLSLLGHQSGFPCPICLIPRDLQDSPMESWPLRTFEGTLELIQEARSKSTKKDRKALLKTQSLRDVKVCFFTL